MEQQALKKKLSVYLTVGGYLKRVSDEVIFQVLQAWENWTGTSAEFYRTLGVSQSQMASIIGKGKKLKRQGHFGTPDFKEITVEKAQDAPLESKGPCAAVEIVFPEGKLIRFKSVDGLIYFMKKSA